MNFLKMIQFWPAYKRHPLYTKTQTENKRMEKDMQTINQKRVEVAILLIISDSINFKAKIITRKKKKKKFYSEKGTSHQEDITIISTYELSNRTHKMHELKTDINEGIDG